MNVNVNWHLDLDVDGRDLATQKPKQVGWLESARSPVDDNVIGGVQVHVQVDVKVNVG